MKRPVLTTVILVLCLAALLQILVLSGCATLPVYRPGIPAAGNVGHALLDEWRNRNTRLVSLQGVARVRVQTPERSVSGTQVILAEEPDRLRTEALSPFGTPLLVIAANSTELAVFLPGENLFYSGRATPENLGRFTRLPLRLPDLIGILLAKPPLIGYQKLQTFQLPEGGWRVELESGQRRQELLFDAARRLKEVRYLQREELKLQLAYNEFSAESQGLPRQIDFSLPLQQTRATLVFKELETNRSFLPGIFTLSPPPGAKLVALDETTPDERAGAVGEAIREEHGLPREEVK